MGAIILAGGKSERMGSPKANLMLGERTLIEWVAQALAQVPGQLLVVARRAPQTLPRGARLVTDEPADSGPLGGLYAGLQASGEEAHFVAGCDTPFLQPALVGRMLELSEGYDVAVPRDTTRMHPLCAVYRRSCRPHIRAALLAGERKLTAFYSQVKIRSVSTEALRAVDCDLLSFLNLNSPSDLARAKKILQERPQGWPPASD